MRARLELKINEFKRHGMMGWGKRKRGEKSKAARTGGRNGAHLE